MENHYISETDLWAYISQSASPSTKQKVEAWIASPEYDDALFKRIKNIYQLTGEHPYQEHPIPPDSATIEAKEKFFSKIEQQKPKGSGWQNFLKYAAIAIVLISTSFFGYRFFSTQNTIITVQTTYGQKKEINLPDGSRVWLNASSSISYSSNSSRNIHLEGEAFFEVAKNKQIPFIVCTKDQLNVKALGTSFNVKSYSQNNYTETILHTGKVEVSSPKHFKEKIEMDPYDQVIFLREEKRIIRSKTESLERNNSWKTGKIQFKNKSFKDIAEDLNIQFNIKINFVNEQLSQSRFTGSFDQHTPVDEILETLKISKPFEYQKVSNNEWIIK
ncbi:FecR family protein [Aquimarina sp. 2201CG5-10]|uniref:FecR family protein n=1 Tax=Aquimarina callyspongiae TaxID=3098150 RepID=UPI002AB542A9|nr:FecR domain-containing protein [Aquimarina sp. 2201CG5-10]MDY8134031.1 FecR domain-containing protein [Aquimarina sp. 2201CG5-10]